MVLDYLLPPDLSRTEAKSPLVLAADGRLLRGFMTKNDYWRLPLQQDEVDPLFIKMLLAYEDQRYYIHPGIDPLALLRALGQWLWHGEVVSGGSTLTMQTARLLHPHPRTLLGKLSEMLRALQLEWRFTKAEILNFYLMLAPYGGNLEGLRAASLAYFAKEPRHLTAAEAALLVVLPQAPEHLRPDRYPQAASTARIKVLQRMVKLGLLTVQQMQEAEQEAVPNKRNAMPIYAPHLARWLRKTQPEKQIIQTTLRSHIQLPLEVFVKNIMSKFDQQTNVAMVVVENNTYEIIAYLGSADFFASPAGGTIGFGKSCALTWVNVKTHCIWYGL